MTSDETLAKILTPHSTDDFMAEFWGKAMLHIEGHVDKFSDLMSWEDLNALLDADFLRPPRLRLVKGGHRLDPARYMREMRGAPSLNPAGFVNCLNEGAGMVIDMVDRLVPAVRMLTEDVEAFFGTFTHVNLYAGWKASKAFGLHWDPHDVIVLQVVGEKAWEVFAPTELHPLITDQPPEPTGEPTWQGTLTQGDMIYLPRGWWHRAAALDEPSLHLTLGVVAPSSADVIASVSSAAIHDPAMRANLPGPGHQGNAGAVELVQAALDPSAIEQFIVNRAAQTWVRPTFNLPQSPAEQASPITGSSLVSLALTRALAFESQPDGTVTLQTNGIASTCSAELVPALRQLGGTTAVALDDLLAMLPNDLALHRELKVLLSTLAMKGAIWTR